MARYFITDCNGKLAGNVKGYRTFRGAEQQANGKTKLRDVLWDTFYAREDKANNLVCAIKQLDTLQHLQLICGGKTKQKVVQL
jgi:outer membrane lipopolysaccharide assembly protein LptE/RlpB